MGEKLEFNTSRGKTKKVEFEINYYTNNHNIYIGLLTGRGANLEPFADVTINLDEILPQYYGYLNTNNLPELKEFVETYGIAEFTGITKKSKFCEYPLYFFQEDRLRGLCPKGILVYEQRFWDENREKPEEKSKSR